MEVCYNNQTAEDAKHKLVVATHVINRNDRNALTDIAAEAKENLKADRFTLLADKGFNNAREIKLSQYAEAVAGNNKNYQRHQKLYRTK